MGLEQKYSESSGAQLDLQKKFFGCHEKLIARFEVTIHKHLAQNNCKLVFQAWKHFYEIENKRNKVLCKYIKRWRERTHEMTFSKWRSYAVQRKRRRVNSERIIKKFWGYKKENHA